MVAGKANYDPDATYPDPNDPCRDYVTGCIDDSAYNNRLCASPGPYGAPAPAPSWGACHCPWGTPCAVDKHDASMCIARVWGCTNNQALNYNPKANTDCNDASHPGPAGCEACIARVWGCTNSKFFTYPKPPAPAPNTDCDYKDDFVSAPSGCVPCSDGGCMDSIAETYDSTATISNPTLCVYTVEVKVETSITKSASVTCELFKN
eukprot:COSAG01_NODE_30264_length_619_cov_1.151923_1_plen_205_part_11